LCSARCRKRSSRKPAPPPGSDSSAVVDAVRAELAAAGRLNTWEGQLALVLARLLETATGSSLAAVSREFRRVQDLALRSSGGAPRAPQPDDPLDELKRRRDGKVQGGTRGRPV
jgi:hypothetical protein